MASIGDINNLQDKENLDIGLVPTHYFDAQGNKRNIAEDVAAIYQAINGKADSSQVGQSIGQLTQAVNSKADAAHKHGGSDIKYEHTDEINFSKNANDSYSSTVYFNYRDGSTDNVNSQNLISTYRFCNRNGTTVGVTLQADQFTGNAATATDADKVDGYHILVNQTVTARTDAIFFL